MEGVRAACLWVLWVCASRRHTLETETTAGIADGTGDAHRQLRTRPDRTILPHVPAMLPGDIGAGTPAMPHVR